MKELLSIAFVVLNLLVYGQKDWTLAKEKNGIKVYTKTSDSGFKSYRGITTIESSLQQCFNLLQDAEQTSNWSPSKDEFKVIKQVNDIEWIEHLKTDLPFPVKDRDIIYQINFEFSADQKSFTKVVTGKPELLPIDEDYERIQQINGFWKITELENGQIELFHEMTTNPGGSLPSWLVNMKIVDEPFTALEAFIKDIKIERYNNPDNYLKHLQ